MLPHVRITRRVEWMDTDAAAIWHWSTVARFAEAGEHALHDALGTTEALFGTMPRLNVSFDFRAPLRFGDEVVIDFAVEHVGRSSVRYRILVLDAAGATAAEGHMTTCHVDSSLGRSAPWPDDVRALLLGGASGV